MRTLLIILRLLFSVLLFLTMLIWFMMHGTSHIIPANTEWGYGIICLILLLILVFIQVMLERKWRKPE